MQTPGRAGQVVRRGGGVQGGQRSDKGRQRNRAIALHLVADGQGLPLEVDIFPPDARYFFPARSRQQRRLQIGGNDRIPYPAHRGEPRWQLLALQAIILGNLLRQLVFRHTTAAGVDVRLIAVLGAIAAPVQEGAQQTESKRCLCRPFGGLVFQPGAHAVGGYLVHGPIQQGQQCTWHRRVALAGPAGSGLGFPAGIDKSLMVKPGALTPLRRTCRKVGLPSVKGRCLDARADLSSQVAPRESSS